jgi:hypothetical protein
VIGIPIEDVEAMQKRLRQIKEIDYSQHFEQDVNPIRDNVSKEKIENHLHDSSQLEAAECEADEHPRDKYLLFFDDSTKYYLKVVVSIADEYLNVVTSHVVSKRRIRNMEEYYD